MSKHTESAVQSKISIVHNGGTLFEVDTVWLVVVLILLCILLLCCAFYWTTCCCINSAAKKARQDQLRKEADLEK